MSIPEYLFKIQSSTVVFSVKTQRAHWNTTGRGFYQLHLLYDRIYSETIAVVDRIAENLRGLDYKIPASLTNYISQSVISEFTKEQDIDTVLKALLSDAQTIARLIAETDEAITNLEMSEEMSEVSMAPISALEEQEEPNKIDYTGICNLLGDLHELYTSFVFLLRASL